jgi:hypothetical protein
MSEETFKLGHDTWLQRFGLTTEPASFLSWSALPSHSGPVTGAAMPKRKRPVHNDRLAPLFPHHPILLASALRAILERIAKRDPHDARFLTTCLRKMAVFEDSNPLGPGPFFMSDSAPLPAYRAMLRHMRDGKTPQHHDVQLIEEQQKDLHAYLKQHGYNAIRGSREIKREQRQDWISLHRSNLIELAIYPRNPMIPSSDDPDCSIYNAIMKRRKSTAISTIKQFLAGAPSPPPKELVCAVLAAIQAHDIKPESLDKALSRHRSPTR